MVRSIDQIALELGVNMNPNERSSWEAITLCMIQDIDREIEEAEKMIASLNKQRNQIKEGNIAD